jgi:hypothetical protein
MFLSRLGMLRYVRLLAPVAAAIVAAGGGVIAVSRATDSTQTQPPIGPADRQGLFALQSAFVKVVSSISPSVVQIEDQRGLGSGIVLDKGRPHRHQQPRRKRRESLHRDDARRQALPREARRLVPAR